MTITSRRPVMKRAMCVVAVALMLAPALARADVDSGPAVGEQVRALKVHAVTGDQAGQVADFAGERKEKPTVYVFVQAQHWTRPVARFLKTLDDAVQKAGNDAAIVAVWLTDDKDATIEYLPRAQNSIQLQVTTYTVHPSAANGPDGWGINSDAHVTVVVAGKTKAAAKFGFVSVNETAVPQVEAELKKVIGKE
jgi:hypothetical protein